MDRPDESPRPDGKEPTSRPPEPSGHLGAPRDRIIAAVVEAVAVYGFRGLDVDRVLVIAEVTRKAFDAEFASLDEALEAAVEASVDEFLAVILDACSAQTDWPLKVKVAIGAALDHVAATPTRASLLDPRPWAVDPRVSRKAIDARDRLAALLGTGRRYSAVGAELPGLTEQAIVAGLLGVVFSRLSEGEAGRLPDIAPELVEMALLPYIGRERAARVAYRPTPPPTPD